MRIVFETVCGLIVSGVQCSSTRRLGNFRCIWEYVAVLTGGMTEGFILQYQRAKWGDPKIVYAVLEWRYVIFVGKFGKMAGIIQVYELREWKRCTLSTLQLKHLGVRGVYTS